MAVTDGQLNGSQASDGHPTLPISIVSQWNTIITGGINTADDADLDEPETQITADTRVRFTRSQMQRGTSLVFRCGIPSGLTGITNPVARVFGRKAGSGQAWQMLQSQNEAFDITFDFAADTTVEGGVRYSSPTKAHIVDMLSCDQFLAGIKTALAAGGTGDVADAFIEVKEL